MIMNNAFKQFREIAENRNGSAVAHSGMMGTTAASLHAVGKYCWIRLKLNICLRIKVKVKPSLQQPVKTHRFVRRRESHIF
jgi:hypothetical protein